MRITLIFGLLLASSALFAQTKYKVISFKTRPNDSLPRIYRLFLKEGVQLTKSHPAVHMTYKKNPEIQVWKKMPEGQQIRVFFLPDDFDRNKYTEYRQTLVSEVEQKKTVNGLTGELENSRGEWPLDGSRLSFYYMLSMGQMTQSNSTEADVSYTQRSFITLGLQGQTAWKNSRNLLGYGFSFSEISASSSNYDDQKITFPVELNAYLYGEHRRSKGMVHLLYGLDYETLNSFDLVESNVKQKVVLEKSTFTYASVGISRPFYILSSPFFTKLVFSKTVLSTSNTDDTYDGYRLWFYLNKKFSDDFYVFTQAKYHSLDGPSKIQAFRMGVGLGWMF